MFASVFRTYVCIVVLSAIFALFITGCQWRSHEGTFPALGDLGILPPLPGGLDPTAAGMGLELLLDRDGRGAMAFTASKAQLHENDADCVVPAGERLLLFASVTTPGGMRWLRARTLTCGDGYLTAVEAGR